MKKKRLRDPVHGLMVFDAPGDVSKLGWLLINTTEFQRLRRVKQLGVSEYTFPGATHNRFAHSLGVFYLAQRLMKIAKSKIDDEDWSEQAERVALISSLLHDVGHGPFSHAFEQAEKERLQARPGAYKKHEAWTAEIIRNPSGEIYQHISEVLNEGVVEEIANLLTSDPTDIYGAVVSSSFDADRLDFLQRDRLMTGSGAGAIDYEWLIDNLDIANDVLDIDSSEGQNSHSENVSTIQTLCFKEKALQAAESFLFARFHLYSQVYFHKTTRGIEKLLTAFLLTVAKAVREKQVPQTGIWSKSPLISYYKTQTPSVDQYLALDDGVVMSALHAARTGKNERLKMLAGRILKRRVMKCIEIETEFPTPTDLARRQYILDNLDSKIGESIFEDRIPLSIYSTDDQESVKPHKRVRIKRSSDASSVDIVMLSKAIRALTEKQELLRYYFLDDSDYTSVHNIKGRQNGS